MMHLLFPACFLLALLQQSHADHRKEFPECKHIYTCHIINTDNEIEVLKDKEVTKDIKAMVKIHAYNYKRYHVVVTSNKNDITSIEFTMGSAHMFTCKNDGDNAVIVIRNEKKHTQKLEEQLRCEGEIRSNEKIIAYNDNVYNPEYLLGPFGMNIITGTSSPITFSGRTTIKVKEYYSCDPDKIKYKTEKIKRTENYKQVNVHLDTFHCGEKYEEGLDLRFINGIYGIEYRKEGEEEYRKVKSLKCRKPSTETIPSAETKPFFVFEFDDGGAPEKVDGDKEMEVRCAADAQFFCEYAPMIKHATGRQPLLLKKNAGNVSTLTCPDSHPFFVHDGKTVKNPVFHCHNIKGQLHWTYGEDVLLQDKEQPIYCSNEIGCSQIDNDYLHQSLLDEENLPMCHDEGELQVEESSSKKTAVKKFTCDRKNGKLLYHTKSGDIRAWRGMNVYCHYGDKNADENKQKKNRIVLIAVSSAVGAFLVVGGIFGGFFYFSLRRLSRKQNRLSGDAKKDDNRFSLAMGRVDPQSSGSEKKKKKSISSANTNVDGPSSGPTVERGQEGKGMFTEENAPLVELEPPPYDKAAIEDAYGDDEYWDDEFPEGYEMPMREEARPLIERLMEKHRKPIEALWREVYAWKEKENAKEEKKNGEKLKN